MSIVVATISARGVRSRPVAPVCPHNKRPSIYPSHWVQYVSGMCRSAGPLTTRRNAPRGSHSYQTTPRRHGSEVKARVDVAVSSVEGTPTGVHVAVKVPRTPLLDLTGANDHSGRQVHWVHGVWCNQCLYALIVRWVGSDG